MSRRLPRIRRIVRAGAASLAAASLFAPTAFADPRAGPGHTPALNYTLNCQGCHLPDGSGAPGKVPDMRREIAAFLTIPGGREYLVQVPGAATSRLGDAEMADLLNWLVKTMAPPAAHAAFRPYTEAEVARLRPHWLGDPTRERARLLALMQSQPQFTPQTR